LSVTINSRIDLRFQVVSLHVLIKPRLLLATPLHLLAQQLPQPLKPPIIQFLTQLAAVLVLPSLLQVFATR